ncbi:D-alanyl-glycyl endopeptidase-like protein [Trypanosoma theileri]|uniref:D-alanyl-glycyl endopeptidase-like protein n=1 Tax=Trypanosoma theileri TaxID=67003 RepID=A0A1X0NY88_9TRYP|nr:D-alanyl-glycyl endopeptidase-like protein [Trypanosoma theileri]ORC89637.1 D-alanyl-glycyl endopeptidase-like protein [Trypanosoma theileri]
MPALVILTLLVYIIIGIGKRSNFFKAEVQMPRRPVNHGLLDCVTPHSTLLGYASGIPAYSNCHRLWSSDVMAFASLAFPDDVLKEPFPLGDRRQLSTGKCWVAAEYVSRFYYLMRGLVFYYDSAEVRQFWSTIEFYSTEGDKRKYEVIELPNYKEVKTAKERKRLAPKFADVVVWASHPERELDEGHAAVVVHVEDDVEAAGGEAQLREMQKEHTQPQLVYIAEQNFDNKDWEGKNYSRVLRFSWKNGKEMLLEDSDDYNIIGRVRPGKVKRDDMDEGDL